MAQYEAQNLSEALTILKKTPLIDGHNDWPNFIRGFYDNRLDSRFDEDKDLAGHVDIKRLLKGKSGGVFWSAYVDCPQPEDDFSDQVHLNTVRETLQQIDLIHRIIERYQDRLELAYAAGDIMRIFRSGKIASLIGVEGLHQIGNSSSILRNYHRLGVRYITLAHNRNNKYADSENKPPVHGGLSVHGQAMVKEMNRIGLMIDLSHVSENVMLDVLETSTAPVAFTHSSCFTIVPKPRNVSDDVLERLKANKGIIMISFIPELTHVDPQAATVDHVVDHIVYVAEKIGFDHVGLGSDFDGMEKGVRGLEDVSQFPNIVACLLARGVTRTNIEKILGRNVISVLETIEEVSNKLQGCRVLEDDTEQLWSDGFRSWVRSKFPNAEHDQRIEVEQPHLPSPRPSKGASI